MKKKKLDKETEAIRDKFSAELCARVKKPLDELYEFDEFADALSMYAGEIIGDMFNDDRAAIVAFEERTAAVAGYVLAECKGDGREAGLMCLGIAAFLMRQAVDAAKRMSVN